MPLVEALRDIQGTSLGWTRRHAATDVVRPLAGAVGSPGVYLLRQFHVDGWHGEYGSLDAAVVIAIHRHQMPSDTPSMAQMCQRPKPIIYEE